MSTTGLSERIKELQKLDQAEMRLRNTINQFHEGRQAFIEQSTRLFAPVTDKLDAETKAVQKVQEAVQEADAAPEEKLIREWLGKVNDPVFGLQTDGEGGYVLGLTSLLEHYAPGITPTRYQIQLDQDGIRVKGTNAVYPITKQNLHALTRNARPLTKAARDVFLRLVDLTLGPDLVALAEEAAAGTADPRLSQAMDNCVKFTELIKQRYIVGSGCEGPSERLAVLLGAAKAGNMQSNLQEFTGILDGLLREGVLNKGAYKEMMRRFLSKKGRHGGRDRETE